MAELSDLLNSIFPQDAYPDPPNDFLLTGKPSVNGIYRVLIDDFLAIIFTGPVFTGIPLAPTRPPGTNDTSLATTAFVFDALASAVTNVGKRTRVRVATTANITIATALNNGDSLDGVTLVTGDLVLVKDQSTTNQNGVYVVGVSPARAAEYDTYNEYPGSLIAVEEGTANADTLWFCTSNEGGTLNTTAIVFSRINSILISDTAYGSGWNGDTVTAPSKNAVYNAIEAMKAAGKQTVWVPASAMIPAKTNGPSTAQLESTTNKLNYAVLDFDGTTQEYAHFQVALPKSWNEGGVSFKAFWATTNTGTAGIALGLQGVANSDADTLDASFGTVVYVTDAAQSSAAKQYVTAESGAVTIAGTPAEGDLVYFRVTRDPTNGSDTMSEDVRLIGIQLFFTTDTGNDA